MRDNLRTIFFLILFCIGFALSAIHVPLSSILIVILSISVIYIVVFVAYVYRATAIGLKLLKTGRYDDAIERFTKLESLFKAPRNWMHRFNKAVACHRKGDLAATVEILNQIDPAKLSRSFAPHYYALYARTLIMNGKEFERADELTLRALGDGDVPPMLADLLLYKCYQACVANNLRLAHSLVAQFSNVIKNRKDQKSRLLKHDWEYKNVLENYLLGFSTLRLERWRRHRNIFSAQPSIRMLIFTLPERANS